MDKYSKSASNAITRNHIYQLSIINYFEGALNNNVTGSFCFLETARYVNLIQSLYEKSLSLFAMA